MDLLYHVIPPPGAGDPFHALIDKGKVTSNRDGSWKPETLLTIADLVMPEQKFGDWEITRLWKYEGEGETPPPK